MRPQPGLLKYAAAAIGTLAGAAAMAAQPGDFRNGLDLDTQAGRPLQELVLPDAVYAGAVRADLGDIAVFNAQGTPVAFAVCDPPVPLQAPAAEVALNVFPLQTAPPGAGAPRSVAVDSAGAVTVTVTPAPATPAASVPAVAAYVIDARKLAAPPRAVRIGWHAADGASEVRVSVEASDDLDRWRTLVAQTALVRLDAAGQTLERMRIELPPQGYA
ncbi:MAG: DUF3999 family protein, partial [Nevskia sp.]|nr:DUF3999 family protein [Nevskia sp.]